MQIRAASGRKLMITIDVEAQPVRAERDHIDRLIWGKFANDRYGIAELMTSAERHGVRLVTYLDYAERYLYGEHLLDVGREIRRRGHDLQLHLHPEFLSDGFFREQGLARVANLNTAPSDAAKVLAKFVCDSQREVTGQQPLGFRGGGYRFNDAMLRALAAEGVQVNSGYNPSRATQPVHVGFLKQFRWEGSMFELPISNVFAFSNPANHLDYNFNAHALWGETPTDCARRHRRYLQNFYEKFGEDAIAVLVLHSWSLLKRDDAGHYQSIGSAGLERFDALLAALNGYATVIDTEGAIAAMQAGALGPSQDLALAEATRRKLQQTPSAPAQPSVSAAPPASPASGDACPICGTKVADFEDFNGPKRRCKGCGSVERQRAFVDFYRNRLTGADSLRGKKVLVIAPSASEKRFLKDAGVEQIITADIRPEIKPDIVLDVCNMANVAANSFDVIVASYVLTCVRSLELALSEMARVLRPGGMLLSSDPISRGQATREHTDEKVITAWYGKEAFDRYGVGSFRSFGDRDVQQLLGAHFKCESFTSRDVANGSEVTWFVSRKAGSAVSTTSASPQSVPSQTEPVPLLRITSCTICGDALTEFDGDQNCKGCSSRARLRALVPLLNDVIAELGPRGTAIGKPLLGFAMTGAEVKLLQTRFPLRKSVSLFGNYATDHELGVDVRDLSRYAGDSFCGVFASLLFDYFEQHERALAECFRVVAPGGVFFTHLAPYRLVDGDQAPRQTTVVKGRVGYFDYLPQGQDLPDVSVGRQWLLRALQRAGFEARLVRVADPVPGMLTDWFIGVKPVTAQKAEPSSKPTLVHRSITSTERLIAARRELFRAPILFGDSGIKSLVFEELSVQDPGIAFAEDTHRPGSKAPREVVVTSRDRMRVYSSDDGGHSFRRRYAHVTFPAMVRHTFTLSSGQRIIKLDRSPFTYLFDADERLLQTGETGEWNWHGTQGIGQAPNGTVMFAEYAAFGKDVASPPLNVWRLKLGAPRWERVLTFETAREPPAGVIRHFHVCVPNPARPGQWILATGDKGEHNRLLTSDDDGNSWQEVSLDGLNVEGVTPAARSGLVRLTQLGLLETGELIWGTDDRLDSGRAALMALSLSGAQPSFRHLGWAGSNAVRNAVKLAPNVFMFLSESKHELNAADCLIFDVSRNRRLLLTLPNLIGASSPVTDSMGSAEARDGLAFFPGVGSILTTSKHGILRLSLQDEQAMLARLEGGGSAVAAQAAPVASSISVRGVLSRPEFRCNPRQDYGLEGPTRVCFWDETRRDFARMTELEADQGLSLEVADISDTFDLKVKIQARAGNDWVDRVDYTRVNVDAESLHGIRYRYFPRTGSQHLVVIFQAMNTTPGYNYLKTLKDVPASRLYIKDDYGEDPATRSSYYLGARRSFDISDGVRSLIREALVDLGLRPRHLILGGSSKGAYAALFHGYALNAGHIVAGGPQVMLGNFLNSKSPGSLHPPILTYLAGDLSADSVAWTNNALFEQMAAAQPPYPKVVLHVGEHEPHYREHVRPLLDFLVARGLPPPALLDLGNYKTHAELDVHFPQFFQQQVDRIARGG